METEKTTITIKKIFENPKPPHKILDIGGNYWKIWGDAYDELNLKENHVYEIRYKPGLYNSRPDNVIKTAILVGAVDSPSAATGPAVAANGHAAPLSNADRERAILTAVLIKTVQPRPYATRQIMADEMYTIWLAANDAADRILL